MTGTVPAEFPPNKLIQKIPALARIPRPCMARARWRRRGGVAAAARQPRRQCCGRSCPPRRMEDMAQMDILLREVELSAFVGRSLARGPY